MKCPAKQQVARAGRLCPPPASSCSGGVRKSQWRKSLSTVYHVDASVSHMGMHNVCRPAPTLLEGALLCAPVRGGVTAHAGLARCAAPPSVLSAFTGACRRSRTLRHLWRSVRDVRNVPNGCAGCTALAVHLAATARQPGPCRACPQHARLRPGGSALSSSVASTAAHSTPASFQQHSGERQSLPTR